MGFNSHIRLFCCYWHGVGKWSENTAEGQNILSVFFFYFASAHLKSYCLYIFSSCQLKDNYAVFSDMVKLTSGWRRQC